MMGAARSYLFVPGDRPERFAKALASGADAVILDLEDAVAPDRKAAARQQVAQWLSPQAPVVLRINAPGTPWFDDDALLAQHPGVAALMLPKAEEAQHIEWFGPGTPVIPLIETAAGFANVRALARASGVQRLAFGAIDFQLDLGLQAGYADLLHFRSEIVLASRLAGVLAPIDSPTVAFDDVAEVERDAQCARRLGFGAKLCIHPRQVEVVNRSFNPSDAEIDWARRVLEVAAASAGAAVAVDGKMIDKPVLLRARAILRDAR